MSAHNGICSLNNRTKETRKTHINVLNGIKKQKNQKHLLPVLYYGENEMLTSTRRRRRRRRQR